MRRFDSGPGTMPIELTSKGTTLNRKTGQHEVNLNIKMTLEDIENILKDIEKNKNSVAKRELYVAKNGDVYNYLEEKFEEYKEEMVEDED